ncbi:MAG: type II secretion system protein [Nitrosomonadales bacterium]|nr:type II secretion system protein [Nitrosomonadales bacterium]
MHRHQQGFTYIAVLILIAILGMVTASIGVVWSTARQQEREQELLQIGGQFQHAIGQYYERSPGTIKRYPIDLNVLLKDDRFMSPQHHLRKIYTDPMTRTQDWGLVRAEDGGIAGVYSLSEALPRKRADFYSRNEGFIRARKYTDWRFVYRPAVSGVAAATASSAALP